MTLVPAVRGFVFAGDDEFNVIFDEADLLRCSDQVFVAFDRRQFANRADAKLLSIWGRESFGCGETLDVDAVMNHTDDSRVKNSLRLQRVSDRLRDRNYARGATRCQLVPAA